MIEASFGNEENEDNVQEEVEECDEVDIAVTMDVLGKLVAENALNIIFMLRWYPGKPEVCKGSFF